VSATVYLNGAMIPLEEAKVSVLDYGFLYGYGLFETMRAYDGRVFLLDRHVKRLTGSMEKLGIETPGLELEEAVASVIRANGLTDARVRLAVSIGEGKMVPDPASCGEPTVLIIASEYTPYPEEVYKKGFRAVVSSIRRNSQSPVSGLKSANYLESLLARQEAKKAGVDEVILLDDRGFLAEASMSNLFLVNNGVLKTPGKESGILPGITREVVLELAVQAGMDAIEGNIGPGELAGAWEAFLTNSIMEIMPLVGLDGRAIGSGSPGPVTRGLMDAYRKLVGSMTSGR
jgi:branched-chain amino acid aminotransferase